MKLPLRVLILEDSDDDALLLMRELNRSGYTIHSKRVETAHGFYEALSSQTWDVVLSDYAMHSFDALAALKILSNSGIDLPFIVISGTINEDVAVECMKAGADDFFSKDKMTRLVPAIEREWAAARERHENRLVEARLRQSELRFRQMFNASPIPICLIEYPSQIILDLNQRFIDVVGYEREDMLGVAVHELGFWQEDVIKLLKDEPLLQQGTVTNIEIRFHKRSGALGYGLISLEMIEIDTQRCILMMMHDITDRKNMELAELKQRAFTLALSETASLLASSLELDEVLDRILVEVAKVLPYTSASIFLIKDNFAHLAHTRGFSETSQENMAGMKLPLATRSLSTMLETGQALTIPDTRTYRGWVKFEPDLDWIRSLVSAPIRTDGKFIGFINLDSETPNSYNKASAEYLQSFADQAAVAIRNAQLYKTLKQNETRLRAVLENFPNGAILMFDHDLAYVLVAGSVMTDLGMQREEIIGHTVSNMGLGNMGLLLEGAYRAALRGETLAPFELNYKDRVFLVQVTSVRDEFDKVNAGLVIAHDITQRKQAEAELQSLYNAISTLFKADNLLYLGQQITQTVVREFGQVDCGVLLVDYDKRQMIRLARAGEYGISTNDTLLLDGPGLVPYAIRTGEMIYLPDVSQSPLYMANVPQTRSEMVVPLRTTRGIIGVLDLQSQEENAFSMRDQRIILAFSERAAVAMETIQLYEQVNRHATELEWRVAKRTAELNNAKERVEDILNNSSDAIILTHADGLIRQTNPTFDNLFKYAVDEVFHWHVSEMIQPEYQHDLQVAIAATLESREPNRVEVECRRRDGNPFYADVGIAPVSELDKQKVGLIFSIRDITQRKKAEAELRHTLEKEKELGELRTRFVSMVSHEYRTPLSIILMNASTLQKYWERLDDEQRNKRFVTIHEQIKIMTDLLDDVLTIARAEAGKLSFEPLLTDFDAFCRIIIEEVVGQPEPTHRVVYQSDASVPPTLIDHKLMRQVLTNLITNAIKYSEQNSTVHINLKYDGESITLKVRDEGIGIPEKDQAHLFEPFYRASNVGAINGTGLGLNIVKRAIEQHRGAIQYSSIAGHGTTFIIELPVVQTLERVESDTEGRRRRIER